MPLWNAPMDALGNTANGQGRRGGTQITSGGGVVTPPTPTIFTDSFDRPDENLEASPNWTQISGATAGAAKVVSNNLTATTTIENAYVSPQQVITTKQFVEYVNNGNGSAGPFVCLRLTDMNNYIGIRSSTTAYQVWKRIAGTLTQLSTLTPAGTPVVGDLLHLEDDGINVSLYLNGALVASVAVTDVPASTRQGINVRSQARTPAWIDNYRAGGLA